MGCQKKSYLVTGFKSFLRLVAGHCPEPSIRIFLYRLSGIYIGRGAYINMFTVFEDDYISDIIRIGERVAVAKNVSFIASSHPNNSVLKKYGTSKFGRIIVAEDAWIGIGAVILPGITIGKCSIIGANAVVTKDVEAYSIITGIPGRRTGDVREKFNVEEL